MPQQRANHFRYEGKFVFLTYPRCELRPETVLAELRKNFDINHWCIASEEHDQADEDGIILHIHAVIEFTSVVRTRNAAAFDIEGFHPNIQSVRSRKQALDYVRKDGDFISNFPETAKTSWGNILAESSNREDFLSRVRSCYPRDYVLSYDRIISFADAHFKPVIPEYVNEYEFNNVHPELTEWVNANLHQEIGRNPTFPNPWPHSMLMSFIPSSNPNPNPNPNAPSARH